MFQGYSLESAGRLLVPMFQIDGSSVNTEIVCAASSEEREDQKCEGPPI